MSTQSRAPTRLLVIGRGAVSLYEGRSCRGRWGYRPPLSIAAVQFMLEAEVRRLQEIADTGSAA